MTKTEFTASKLAIVDRAIADQRLTHLDFRLFSLMASAADWRTAVTRRRQTVLAEILGVTTRMVRYCLDRLVRFGYLEPIGHKPGKYISGYKVVMSEKRKPTSAFEKAEISNQKARKRLSYIVPLDPLISLPTTEKPNQARLASARSRSARLRR